MKVWIPILILFLAVTCLCIWDGIYTQKVFEKLENDSEKIYETLLTTEITDPKIQNDILNLNKYWTEKMDILCISISRKDLQPISDYLQFLCSSIINENQEDAVTYSRLLNYNIVGMNQMTGINILNLI